MEVEFCTVLYEFCTIRTQTVIIACCLNFTENTCRWCSKHNSKMLSYTSTVRYPSESAWLFKTKCDDKIFITYYICVRNIQIFIYTILTCKSALVFFSIVSIFFFLFKLTIVTRSSGGVQVLRGFE